MELVFKKYKKKLTNFLMINKTDEAKTCKN